MEITGSSRIDNNGFQRYLWIIDARELVCI